jgi:uncharacterized protein YciI
MHFIVTAYDGKDSEAGPRRKIAREQHLAGVKRLVKERRHLFGAAILDEGNQMIGSVLIVDYPSKEILISEWLNSEPYVTGNVWESVEIKPCMVPDFFLDTNKVN